MSGFGVEYPPPTEDLPIFDPTVFLDPLDALSGSSPSPSPSTGGLISVQTFTSIPTVLTSISLPPKTNWVRAYCIGYGGNAGANNGSVQGGGGGAGASIMFPCLPVSNTTTSALPVFTMQRDAINNSWAFAFDTSYATGGRLATVGAGGDGFPAVGTTTGGGGAGGKIDSNNYTGFGNAGNSIGGQNGNVGQQSAQFPALSNYFSKQAVAGYGWGGFHPIIGNPAVTAPTGGILVIWSYI